MLDIKKILVRSWHILWNYRTLWVFGFILALAAGSGGGNGGGHSSSRSEWRDDEMPREWQAPGEWHDGEWRGLEGETPGEVLQSVFAQMTERIAELQAQYPVEFEMGIAVAVTFFIVALLAGLIVTVLYYVAETATIRMVDEYEQSGVKVGVRQGWRYGWSRAAWRVFFINFMTHLPVFFMLGLVLLVTWWIISAALGGVQSALVSSLVAGIGLVFLAGFVTFIVMVVLYVVRDFAWRFAVLEDKGVRESLALAFAFIKRNWKNVGYMWLVVLGLQIVWAIAFILLVIPLMIVSIATALGGILVVLIPALGTAGLASLLSAPGYWPWAFALVVSAPLFMIVAFSPIFLVQGWALTFLSSTWTLTYREIKTLETVGPALEAVDPAPEA
jgi:hypothetical protein